MHLHNNEIRSSDKIAKVRPILNCFRDKARSLPKEQRLSIILFCFCGICEVSAKLKPFFSDVTPPNCHIKKWVKKSIVGVGVSEDRKRRLELMGINPEDWLID